MAGCSGGPTLYCCFGRPFLLYQRQACALKLLTIDVFLADLDFVAAVVIHHRDLCYFRLADLDLAIFVHCELDVTCLHILIARCCCLLQYICARLYAHLMAGCSGGPTFYRCFGCPFLLHQRQACSLKLLTIDVRLADFDFVAFNIIAILQLNRRCLARCNGCSATCNRSSFFQRISSHLISIGLGHGICTRLNLNGLFVAAIRIFC